MKIVFTSCMDAIKAPDQQAIWQRIESLSPDVLLLLGDQIYMDWMDAENSEWKDEIDSKGPKAIDAFAVEMHRRYKAQAAVPAFASLMRHMKADGRSVHMTYDDHDFAWNNSTGEPPPAGSSKEALKEWDRHGVPFPDVKRYSALLFRQFRQFDFQNPADYPPLSAVLSSTQNPVGCIDPPNPIKVGPNGKSVDLLMLDTRCFRTPRKGPGTTILGPIQLSTLVTTAQDDAGLLIVGAGTPMRHRYLFGKQDWTGGTYDDEYVDFPAFLKSVKRPILYLSGDVHFNAWGGPVRRYGTEKSNVIQILASAASLDNIAFKDFPPSFGILEIDTQSGKVVSKLVQDTAGQFVQTPGERIRELTYTADHWHEVETGDAIDGEAAEDVTWLHKEDMNDTKRMSVISGVPRKNDWLGQDFSAPLDRLDQIDVRFKDTLNASGGPAQGAAPLTKNALFAQVDPNSGHLDLTTMAQDYPAILHHAFQAAHSRNTSVVFHIHGVGKTPTDAIDQGYALRRLYGCEPIVFCWPVGVTTGRFGVLMAPGKAKNGIVASYDFLRDRIKEFAAVARSYTDVPAIILARSAGAALLSEALAGGASNSALESVRRIVLSSPALTASQFDKSPGNAFNMTDARPTFVTINRLDRTLRMANWGMPGEPLGLIDPGGQDYMAAVKYVQFASVGGLHDYLLNRISQEQFDLNKAMLTRANFDLATHPGLVANGTRGDNFTLP